ncbi:hypothetical protein SAMN05443377_101199 [Propionibacterium cyclohexanicum]|uniref:Uncharacterized protein n=1 Tax=Propionibacterium cyclohexanicum TaxID=64702 RepID=A0A1H9PQH2_9ACTN|nr:hypothetical protein [Propionibacterium cyclohexanicum]SER50378.1 hypothetical protein SAMN05443377_101199 [Propionibacterium cyclohexanicum]
MSVFILALIAALALAVAVGAVVAIGIQGYYRDRNPRLARLLHRIARLLNGEPPPVSTGLEDASPKH